MKAKSQATTRAKPQQKSQARPAPFSASQTKIPAVQHCLQQIVALKSQPPKAKKSKKTSSQKPRKASQPEVPPIEHYFSSTVNLPLGPNVGLQAPKQFFKSYETQRDANLSRTISKKGNLSKT